MLGLGSVLPSVCNYSLNTVSVAVLVASIFFNSLQDKTEAAMETDSFCDVSVPVFPPGPNSQALLKRLDNAIGHTNYVGLYGIGLKKGSGPYMMDLDDNIYLDCLAAASVNVLGYGNEEIPMKLYNLASSMQNTGFIYSPNIQAVELAENLIRITDPVPYPKRVLIGMSGSDSIGGALEAVRKYTKKMGIIHFKNAYHGSTGLSQPASGFGTLNDGIYPPSPEFVSVDFPKTPEQAQLTLSMVKRHLESGKFGGVVAEIFQGDAGVFLPAAGFFEQLQLLLKQYDALLVADEIQSGMGRTGKWWACEHEGVTPDVLVTGKGLAGGFAPVSAAIGREEVLDALSPGQQVFTFTGHPVGALAATSVIHHIESHGLITHVEKIGWRLKFDLDILQQEFPDVIIEVRGKGLMIGVEINVTTNFYGKLSGVIFATRCVEKGVYVGYFGVNHEVVRIEPPLTLNEKEAKIVVETIKCVAKEMKNQQIPQETIDNVHKYSVGL